MSIQEIVNQWNKSKEQLQEDLKDQFLPELQKLVDQSNNIHSIGWTQYTPYFNDGDECIFGVNTWDLIINGEYEYDLEKSPFKKTLYKQIETEEELALKIKQDEESKRNLSKWYTEPEIKKDYVNVPNEHYLKKEDEILRSIKQLLEQIPSEVMKDMFGDHTKVTIDFTNNNPIIDTEEYDHD